MLNISEPVTGKFRKVRVDPIKRIGQYRGKGSLQLTPEGLKISGRHVMTMGARWGIGLGLFFGTLILSMALTEGNGYCAPGFIPIYFLVEYFLLKREELLVPYSKITAIGGDAKHTLVGIEFEGEPNCSPVVFSTPQWKALLQGVKQKTSLQEDVAEQEDATVLPTEIALPRETAQAAEVDKDGTQVQAGEAEQESLEVHVKETKPWSRSKLLIRSTFAGIGWYFLFYLITTFLLVGIFSLAGIKGIPGIPNLILRIIVTILLFLIPAIPTYFLTRRYYRKKIELIV